jgi:poly(A) polymerase
MEQVETASIEQEHLRAAASCVAELLLRAGHEAWFVGGCVRDGLLALPLKDIDIATNARPEQAAALFSHTRMVGAKFGVLLVSDFGPPIEVATFRRDGLYLDHRHPDSVSFGTLEDDARRRDFTINALYEHPRTGELRDLVGGRADLEACLLRCVGDPMLRFHEDALRLLRAIRFATRLGFAIEHETLLAMKVLAPTIDFISPERHRDELERMFTGPAPGRALRLMLECGLLGILLPEIGAMVGVEQGAEYHPEGDVFTHTCLALDKLEPRTPLNAWATLLHDVAKPVTLAKIDGRISFREHERIGAEMAVAIMQRLRCPGDLIAAVSAVVRSHMTFLNIREMNKATLRRFLARPTIEADLAVHRADCLGSCGKLADYNFAVEKLAAYQADAPSPMPEPLINGNDLKALGLRPGPHFAPILRATMDLQLEGTLTTRDAAIEWVKLHHTAEQHPEGVTN